MRRSASASRLLTASSLTTRVGDGFYHAQGQNPELGEGALGYSVKLRGGCWVHFSAQSHRLGTAGAVVVCIWFYLLLS